MDQYAAVWVVKLDARILKMHAVERADGISLPPSVYREIHRQLAGDQSCGRHFAYRGVRIRKLPGEWRYDTQMGAGR